MSKNHELEPRLKTGKNYSRRAVALAAAVSSVVSAGITAGVVSNNASKDQKQAVERALDKADELMATQQSQLEAMSTLNEQMSVLVLSAGLPPDQLTKRLSYKTLESVPKGTIDPEYARKQDKATLYVYSVPSSVPHTAETRFFPSCTALKTGNTTLSSAAHCFEDVVGIYENGDGGRGAAGEIIGYSSPNTIYISDQPSLPGNNLENGTLEVGAFAKDHNNTDYAVLRVLPGTQAWFDEIEPMQMSYEAPSPGTNVRISGYPSSPSGMNQVSAEGVVLGAVPSDTFGYYYASELMMVGIKPDNYDPYACSHGSSGGSILLPNGDVYGALAYVGRSDNPDGTIDATPEAAKLLDMEADFETRLLGEDYILCGYAMPEQLNPEPLSNSPILTDGVG